MKNYLIIAHRGYSHIAPENTLEAIHEAINYGVDGVEFDVHLTKDHVPVVIHDHLLQRTTNGKSDLRVMDATYEEISQYEVGSWFDPKFAGTKIPTLDEILDIPRKRENFFIELKGDHCDPLLMASVIVKHVQFLENYVLGSFNPHIIQEIQRLNPSLPVLGHVHDKESLEIYLNLGVRHLAVCSHLAVTREIEGLAEQGIVLWSYTVDDKELAEHLVADKGITGIITNDPSIYRE